MKNYLFKLLNFFKFNNNELNKATPSTNKDVIEHNIPLNFKNRSIIAKDKIHLDELIKQEIELNGNNCDLNHIDVSNIIDMSFVFCQKDFNGNISKWDLSNAIDMQYFFHESNFNGDISQWNLSNVENMMHMFSQSIFEGDISNWNVSKVKNMRNMFQNSKFNGDISNWDVSSLEDMGYMFDYSNFTRDLSNWMPCKLSASFEAFTGCKAKLPWFLTCEKEEKQKIFDTYNFSKELHNELKTNDKLTKRIKI